MDTDRNFRFGLQAVAKGLIDAKQLALAGRDWLGKPDGSLADLLESRGWISHADRAALEETAPNREFAIDSDAPTVSLGADRRSHANGMAAAVASGSTLTAIPGGVCVNGDYDRSREPRGFGPRYRWAFFHAEGGIGRVWKARDSHLGREIALKELRPEYAGDPRAEKRFRAEARITARLEHPNIVPMYDLPTEADRPFYTMRFLDGMTLKAAVQEYHRARPDGSPATLDFRGLLERFVSVCNAIAFAHEQGIIHRDLKGQNVMLGRFGEVAVLDWGLARELDSDEDPLAQPTIDADSFFGDASRTMEGYPIGTAQYMPPEQAYGSRDSIGPRSDIFGLGAILYMILTGRPPYEGGDVKELIRKAREHDFLPPSKLRRDVPKPLESICLKAMAKDVKDRYKAAGELALDVRRWLADEPTVAHEEGLAAKSARWARKHQPAVAGMVAILLASSLMFGFGEWRVGRETEEKLIAQEKQYESREDADASLRASVKTILTVLNVVQTDLPKIRNPEIDAVRSKTADAITKLASDLANRHPNDLEIRLAIAGALREAAKIRALMYQLQESERLSLLAVRTTAKARGVGDEAVSLIAGRDNETQKIASRKKLFGVDRRIVSSVVPDVIRITKTRLLRGDVIGAEAVAAEALTLCREWSQKEPINPDAHQNYAHVLMMKAEIAANLSDFAGAIEADKLAIAEFDALASGTSPSVSAALLSAICSRHVAECHRLLGQIPQAEGELNQVERRVKTLLGADPGNPDLRHLAAIIGLDEAQTLDAAKDHVSARKRLNDELIGSFDELATERPAILQFRTNAALARIIRGELRGDAGSKADFVRASKDLAAILLEAPEAILCRGLLARAEIGLARVALAESRVPAAKGLLDRAEADLKAVTELNPRDPEARRANDALKTLRKETPGL